MQHYYAVAEPDGAGGFWISFPGRDGIGSAADSAGEIVSQARDALESVLMYPPGYELPPSIEDGAKPPTDLSEFDNPIIVVIPFEPETATTKAAA